MSGITIEKRNAQPTLCVRVRTTAKELPKLIEEKTADIRAYLSFSVRSERRTVCGLPELG
jgi:hypothetical protein